MLARWARWEVSHVWFVVCVLVCYPHGARVDRVGSCQGLDVRCRVPVHREGPSGGGARPGRPSGWCFCWSCPQGSRTVVRVDEVLDLPVVVVTVEGGGLAVVPVVEVDGVLVDRRDGVCVEMVSVVKVIGLPALVG
jgi:hypothetical protein